MGNHNLYAEIRAVKLQLHINKLNSCKSFCSEVQGAERVLVPVPYGEHKKGQCPLLWVWNGCRPAWPRVPQPWRLTGRRNSWKLWPRTPAWSHRYGQRIWSSQSETQGLVWGSTKIPSGCFWVGSCAPWPHSVLRHRQLPRGHFGPS